MTALVNATTSAVIGGRSYDALSSTIGIIGIVLLALLLVEKEVLRAASTPRARFAAALDGSIAPLLLMFTVIMIARLLSIFHLR